MTYPCAGVVQYPGHHLHAKRVRVLRREEHIYCGDLDIGPLYVVRHDQHPGMDYGLPIDCVRILAQSEAG